MCYFSTVNDLQTIKNHSEPSWTSAILLLGGGFQCPIEEVSDGGTVTWFSTIATFSGIDKLRSE